MNTNLGSVDKNCETFRGDLAWEHVVLLLLLMMQ